MSVPPLKKPSVAQCVKNLLAGNVRHAETYLPSPVTVDALVSVTLALKNEGVDQFGRREGFLHGMLACRRERMRS